MEKKKYKWRKNINTMRNIIISMPTLFIKDLSKEEKRRLDIAKAKSEANSWKEFLIELMNYYEQGGNTNE